MANNSTPESKEKMRLAWIKRKERGYKKRFITKESQLESVRKFKETWNKKTIGYVSPLRTKMGDIEYGRELFYRNYKTVGKMKFGGLDLTKEQFNSLIINNCVYCGAQPEERYWKHSRSGDGSYFIRVIANGIDRIDSSKPYTIENSVSCCKTCNYMKNKLSTDKFKEHIRKVYNYLWK